MSGKLFIVSAPSGAGKTSLVENVLPKLKQTYQIDRLITCTSRKARPGERQGVDFTFMSEADFEMKIKQGFFIEWSKAYDHYYGSPVSVIDDLKNGASRVLVIDRLGAKQVLERVSGSVSIWIYPSSIGVLRERLLTRGANTLQQVERRLELAKFELEDEAKNNLYTHHVLNDIFDEASEVLETIFVNELKKF